MYGNEATRNEKALLLMLDENRRSIPETNEELIGGQETRDEFERDREIEKK